MSCGYLFQSLLQSLDIPCLHLPSPIPTWEWSLLAFRTPCWRVLCGQLLLLWFRNTNLERRMECKYRNLTWFQANRDCFSCQAVQNLGLAIVTMISGVIVDKGGFFMLEIFFIGWLCGKFKLFKPWTLLNRFFPSCSIGNYCHLLAWLWNTRYSKYVTKTTRTEGQFYVSVSFSLVIYPISEESKFFKSSTTADCHDSAENTPPNPTSESIRNRYLNRVGVADASVNSSDVEPLLE